MAAILLNTLLTDPLRPGRQATAATATIPAASAYSTKSWPWVSVHRRCSSFFISFALFLLGTCLQDQHYQRSRAVPIGRGAYIQVSFTVISPCSPLRTTPSR